MKILFVKSIFCPSNEYFISTISSIIKISLFIKLLKIDNIKFDLYLIGWGYKFINNMEAFIKILNHNFENIYKEYWTINYGKYKVLNTLIDFNVDFDYLIYFDHDIFFDFKSLFKFSNFLQFGLPIFENKNIGLIAFNQKQDCRHQISSYENCEYINGFTYIWSNDVGSIATGAIIMKAKVLKSLSKFELLSVYGLDDYHLCNKLLYQGHVNMIITNIYVYHPFDNNLNYSIWKKNNIIKLINGKEVNYFQNIEESMNILTQ